MDHREGRYTLIRLEREALRERARLVGCRELSAAGVIDGSGERLLVTCSRRTSIRRRLLGRVLVLIETRLEDACGAVHAAHSIGALIQLRQRLAPAVMKRILRLSIAAAVDQSRRAEWARDSTLVHEAFWRARRDRATWIAESLKANRHEPFQAGLFDRRAERTHADDLSRRDSAAARMNLMAAPLELRAARATLALIPWRS